MNQNETNNPARSPDLTAINERVAAAVHSHQRKARLLTGAALLCGFLAIAASFAIVAGYFVLYRPKQMQLMQDFGTKLEKVSPENPASPPDASPRARYDFPHIQVIMTHALSFGTMLIAVAVGFLAAGTLIMLALVVVQRRATLQQVSASLAQISDQLKQLQPRGN